MNRFNLEDFFMDKIFPTLVIAFILIVGWATVRDAIAWQKFTEQHECHEVDRRDGGYIMSARGVMVPLPDHIAYLCDDGKTYWR